MRAGYIWIALVLLTSGYLDSDGAGNKAVPAQRLEAVLGTWAGTSTCVGNRPACKNENVVYRFMTVEGHPSQVRLFADKILEGRRVPMGALLFDVNEGGRSLRSEFKIGQTHGVWSFTVVTPDSMTGTLVTLPAKSIERDVRVQRAKDTSLPEAPPLSDYDE